MTLLWFVIWLWSPTSSARTRLTLDPVNWWMGTLILAIALDLGRQHATVFVR